MPRSPYAAPACPSTAALTALPVTAVTLGDGFWGHRQELNTRAIIPHAVGWMEKLGWVDNFRDAAGDARYEHRGAQFADSEIHKLIEAISWDAARGRNDNDEILDRLLSALAGAQDPDGYLHTLFGRPWQQPRFSDLQWGHELYCFGHLIQAAVAHHRATGSDRFLAIARRVADHVCVMFGDDGMNRICGHPEIEPALVELFRETGDERYLRQAKLFVDRRGTGTLGLHEFGTAYWQDDMPVRAATVLRGHAVRALYLAAGAVDVAVETGDDELLDVLREQWDNTVARRTYITGGMGSHHMDEAFGDDFVLPPDRSYCETCAGIASIMFSWRLLLATGEAKYADLIERTLYNVVATAPSDEGTAFFYANTLHQRTEHGSPALSDEGVAIRGGAAGRQAWFVVSCCPPNLARTLASLGSYLATASGSAVQIHQFASATIEAGGARIEMTTAYPDDGRVTITATGDASVALRVPAWAEGATLTSGGETAAVAAGGYTDPVPLADGESLVLDLPLEVRVTHPDERIDAIRGTVAIERGPEVYALESVDLPGDLAFEDLRLTGEARWDGDTVTVRASAAPRREGAWPYDSAAAAAPASGERDVRLVRYHGWARRGPSRMRVWIPTA
ncbi:hypothetical protein GCM10010922_09920 [Microbacterium sorbitolivorans]|uniref:glycoside hydrolase family 127 protein n=1 Tax=Microbacterium sorbitolivorans TaxID=1867410 RepID=UPI0019BA2343|nr:beta-L-arabinofuranosidase domain-containing protein [Microbacterium sorbitolivorans]GGF36741.1 hypothetical protein GCM10010922_09920 [Microbacterium sorbitolivorans]